MDILIKLTEAGEPNDIFMVDIQTGLAKKMNLGMKVHDPEELPVLEEKTEIPTPPPPQTPMSKAERDKRRDAADRAAGLID